ncbi:MAG: alpha-L-fucosidase [Ignavibacteriaceae bacterium]
MNKKILFIILALSFGISIISKSQVPDVPFQPTWESLSNYHCPEWFRDAKFGIFIHWGVYSVPAYGTEWYPRLMYSDTVTWGLNYYQHHVKTYGTPDKFGYKEFIPMFKAEKFDANKWVELFKKSGAKYIVPVAEHHDGFAMYKSDLTRWNAFNMGPKRDVIGELAEAARAQGLIFGLSSHRAEHWWYMGEGKKLNSDVNDPKYADFYGPATLFNPFEAKDRIPASTEFMNDWLLRCCELVNKYHPQVFYFDWYIEVPEFEPYRKTFAAYYYNHAKEWGKEVVINYKDEAYPDNVAVYDIERGSSRATKKFPWQTDTSIGKKSWGYIDGEENKSPGELIDLLIDIVSKNGNLLLNVGPKPDGTITQEQTNVLLSIGKWLDVNGEGIYGTRPWDVAEEGPTIAQDGTFAEFKPVNYTSKDIRFTTKNGFVYAFLLDIPIEKISIISLAKKAGHGVVGKVELLGSKETIKWSQNDNELQIEPSNNYPSAKAICYRISFKNFNN